MFLCKDEGKQVQQESALDVEKENKRKILRNAKVDQFYGIVSSLTGTPLDQKVKYVDQKQGQSEWDADVRQTLFWQVLLCEDEETHCGRNYQNIFKVVLNLRKNNQIILGRR